MLGQCHGALGCSSYLLVCAFYGYSLAFLDRHYRIWCSLSLVVFLLLLYIVGVGTAPWYSLSAVLLGFLPTWHLSPLGGFLLPIRLTIYPLVNIMIFFVPFIPVVITAGQYNNNDEALAMLLFTSVLLPVPWTLLAIIELVVHRQPIMLENTNAKEHAQHHAHSRKFLRLTWSIGVAAVAISAALVLLRWLVAG